MQRRDFLATVPMAVAAAAAAASTGGFSSELPNAIAKAGAQLDDRGKYFRFPTDGSFKILSISDFHYDATPDTYGISMVERLIHEENPDLVIVNGDTIEHGHIANVEEMKKVAENVAAAMEKMGVPWVVTLGNHDPAIDGPDQVTRENLMSLYETYPHNHNAGWPRDITGVENKNILIWDATETKPLFCIWLLDSGRDYPPDPTLHYDWLRADQLEWYRRTSLDLERTYREKISGLMFFHIPLPEFQELVYTSYVVGSRGEPLGCSRVNSGMFTLVMERQDVKGIFCGHDHENNYYGKHHSVSLGYDGVAGFIVAYPHFKSKDPNDLANGRARGGRVFVLNAANPGAFDSWMRFNDGSRSWESSHWWGPTATKST